MLFYSGFQVRVIKHLVTVFLVTIVMLSSSLTTARAQSLAHPFAAGIVIGDPTGLSFKYLLNKNNSMDAALAWSGSINFLIQGTYLWHKPNLFKIDQVAIDSYFGVGARLRDRSDKNFRDDEDGLQLGVRAPAGLNYYFQDPRFELFSEISIVMNLVPETDADLDFGIGARYYF